MNSNKLLFVPSILALIFSLSLFVQAQPAGGLAERVAALEAEVAALQSESVLALSPYVSVSMATVNGLAGPHIFFDGANVHIRDGSGTTFGLDTTLGNLIIGYNEEPFLGGSLADGERDGSHNLIVGRGHRYSNFGGLVAGRTNTISGQETSVSGGVNNTASFMWASVSGGESNEASGHAASVSGGVSNIASGRYASVSGGLGNEAAGTGTSVSGGDANEASGDESSVSGGHGCTESRPWGASVGLTTSSFGCIPVN